LHSAPHVHSLSVVLVRSVPLPYLLHPPFCILIPFTHISYDLYYIPQVLSHGELPRKCTGVSGGDGAVTYTFESPCKLGIKLAGVHWWFKSRAHAAELTAG
jgi:hypothetical protein